MEDNRSRLLACALVLFATRGYDAVGVQEVADAAGLKKPTLYHYFGSKSGLLKTLLDENFAELFSSLKNASTFHRDVITTLRNIAVEYFNFASKHPRFYRLQLFMWFAPPESAAFSECDAIIQRQLQLLEVFLSGLRRTTVI